MDDDAQQEAQRVDQDVPLATFDLLARVVARRIERSPPFLSAFRGLGVDDRCRRARFTPCLLAHRNVKRMMDALQCSVPIPEFEIVMHRALGWQVFGNAFHWHPVHST